jgi:hypothetical protein
VEQDPGAAFEEVVRGTEYMVLATADEDGLPWATPVWFATEDLVELFWVSRPGARHSTNLAARPELGITVFDSRQPAGTGRGAYVSAIGGPVLEDDLDRGLAIFSRGSERAGAGPWGRADVTGAARHRLYRATAVERFVLSARDERIPVPPLP